MKIALKSNYEKFSKRLFDFGRYLTEGAIPVAVESLLDRMCQEMIAEIRSGVGDIREGSGLADVDLDDIKYEFDGRRGTIHVGRESAPIVMKDGRTVNPYMFIQFGYGIVGEENPIEHHIFSRWQYNVNKHVKAWTYVGGDGQTYWTRGLKGTNFFYSVINKYRKEWKNILRDEIKDYYNRGT